METRNVTQADTGLGTTFERWALNRLLMRLQIETGIRTVLEGPGDGMTGIAGINSLILGLQGASVTLMLQEHDKAELAQAVWARYAPSSHFQITCDQAGDRLPFRDGEFDLVWNFNIMTRLSDPHAALAELCRVSSRYVLICVPNRLNYGFGLHRVHHHVAHQPWDHGSIDLIHPELWRQMMVTLGMTVCQTIWLDCPWWPDIIDLGKLIADLFPFLSPLAQRAKPEARYRWPVEGLPYYDPDRYPEVHGRMARLAFFENSRQEWIKRRFAHHFGLLAMKA